MLWMGADADAWCELHRNNPSTNGDAAAYTWCELALMQKCAKKTKNYTISMYGTPHLKTNCQINY